ncbi:MAG: hypothetical protein ACOYK1_01185 [Vampirovibrionia bacterium]
MGTNPLNLSSLKEALPSLGLGNGAVPDPKELAKDLQGGTYQTLTIKSAYGPDGKLDFPKLQKGIAAYQLGHQKNRSLAESLANLGTLWGGVHLLLANQLELLKKETSSLSAAPRQFQKILNAPANLINRGAQPKLDAEQFSILQEAMPAFLLGSGRSQYETTAKTPVAKALTTLTKPLVFISSKIMGAFGLLKLASLGLNMMEKADPQANPNPDFRNGDFLNDLADRGLGFFPLVKSLADLNRWINTSKGNISMAVNGVGGLFTNAMLFKNHWNNVLEGLTDKEENGEYSLPEKILAMSSYLGLDDSGKQKLRALVSKFIDVIEQGKFKDISDPSQRVQALAQAFKGLSFLGDNRGEAVRDQGNFVAKTLQRFMSVILDLPANSMLAIRTLSVFDKLRKHETVKDEDLENIEAGVKLKSSAIMVQNLFVPIVLKWMTGKINFSGSLADLKSLESWKERVEGWSTGLTNATFLPFAGTIFGPFKNWVISSIDKKEKKILRSGIADKIPDIDAGLVAA